MTPVAPWLDIARAELGIREIAGAQANPRIAEYHASTTLHATSDEVPWCSSFVNWCLDRAGIAGTRSAAAASWLTWGAACVPELGCLVVLQLRHAGTDPATGSVSGYHVGFWLAQNDTHVKVLGGNQGDAVKESRFPLVAYRLAASRWPL